MIGAYTILMALDILTVTLLLCIAWDDELELSHSACFGTWALILTLFANGVAILMLVNGWNPLRIFS